MTKDRIKDLQKPTPWPRVSYRRLSRQHRLNDLSLDLEELPLNRCTTIPIDDHQSNITEFLSQIDLIQLLIDKIVELAKEVHRIHLAMLEPAPSPKLSQELDEKNADIKKLAYDISTKLKKMEQAQLSESEVDRATAQGRIKESQIFAATRRFRHVMNEYNQESLSHRDRCKKVISRELEISGSRRTDDELEEMLENGYAGTFNGFVLVDTQRAKQSLDEIEARHRDITKLEQTIRELHSMFADLAVLVATQGEMINNIQYNVNKTVDYIDDAASEMEKAKELHEAATKKKYLVIIICTVSAILLLILLVSYVFVQTKILG